MNLMVDLDKLLNELVLHAYADVDLLYNSSVDSGVVDLLTKRQNLKVGCSPSSIEVFYYLNTVSNCPHTKVVEYW